MLGVSLGRLGREGSVRVDARIPAEDPLWNETAIAWDTPVQVGLQVSFAGTGEVVARGRVVGTLGQECRRCLRPVPGVFDQEVTLVFLASDSLEGDDPGEARIFEPTVGELDLSEAVREEVLLAVNRYVVCDPQCQGLCPKCGTNLNEQACGCTDDEPDPRWETLRALKDR